MKTRLGEMWHERADEICGFGKYRRSPMVLKVVFWELKNLLADR
jgi:hypothetical protein